MNKVEAMTGAVFMAGGMYLAVSMGGYEVTHLANDETRLERAAATGSSLEPIHKRLSEDRFKVMLSLIMGAGAVGFGANKMLEASREPSTTRQSQTPEAASS